MSENALWLLAGFVMGYNFSLFLVLGILALLYALVFAVFMAASRPLVRSWAETPLVGLKMQLTVLKTLGAFIARGFKPLHKDWSLTYEVTVMTMRFMFLGYGETIAFENAALMRPPFAMVGKLLKKSNCKEHGTRVEPVTAHGLEHYWLRDERRSEKSQRLVVIHHHGSGYSISDPMGELELGNLTHSLIIEELRETHKIDNVAVDVLLANYRKSPEHKYPAAVNDCRLTYEFVLKTEGVKPHQIILSGDSAGAEMSLTTCMNLRDEGRSADLPLLCLLYSPDVDMSVRNADPTTPHCILTDGFADNVLDTYLSTIKDDPEALRKASPINRDLTGLPPLFIQVGRLERFCDSGILYTELAKKSGVDNVELDVLENMPHDVVMFPTMIIPFAKEATRHGCVFAAKHAARVLNAGPEPEPEN